RPRPSRGILRAAGQVAALRPSGFPFLSPSQEDRSPWHRRQSNGPLINGRTGPGRPARTIDDAPARSGNEGRFHPLSPARIWMPPTSAGKEVIAASQRGSSPNIHAPQMERSYNARRHRVVTVQHLTQYGAIDAMLSRPGTWAAGVLDR